MSLTVIGKPVPDGFVGVSAVGCATRRDLVGVARDGYGRPCGRDVVGMGSS